MMLQPQSVTGGRCVIGVWGSATMYTRSLTKQVQRDIQKHSQQYPPIIVKEIKNVHDRFLIVDAIQPDVRTLGLFHTILEQMNSSILNYSRQIACLLKCKVVVLAKLATIGANLMNAQNKYSTNDN